MSRQLWPIAQRQITPYIHGQFTKPSFDYARKLINPVDKSEFITVCEASPAQLEEALISANEAATNSDWQTDHKFRRDRMLRLANELERHDHDMAHVESLQTGKPLSDSLYEINDVVDCLRHYAGYCDKLFGQSQQFSNMHGYTIRQPLGTVSLITSFNYPLLLTGWKLGPALAAGNVAIIKPAPQTPLSSLALAELSTDILPPGVLQVLPGGSELGQALIDRTDKTSFTGSTAIGQDIMRRAANKLTPLTLECGGKNAVIVCADADLDMAVEQVAIGAFSNTGQNCCAISRVLVHSSVHDKFIHKLSHMIMSSWKATLDTDNTMGVIDVNPINLYGPLIDSSQYNRVMDFIKNSSKTAHGSIITAPIQPTTAANGYFVPPTIFTDVDDSSDLARQEIFGPILSVLKPFNTLDEAIERVNQSEYGLAAGIFSANYQSAYKAANQIKAGMVWINMYNIMPPSLPFGGTKMSGIGKDLGKTALDEFTFEKVVMTGLSCF